MTTLIGFARLRPGTTWRLPPLPTEQCAEEDAVHKKSFQRTFSSVPRGYRFYTTHLGKLHPFTSLHKEYLVNESSRGRFRLTNAILCNTGEPVYVDASVAVLRVNPPPERKKVRKLRRLFFVDFGGGQIIPVNGVHEDADVESDPHSKSGMLEFFEDHATFER